MFVECKNKLMKDVQVMCDWLVYKYLQPLYFLPASEHEAIKG